MGLIDEEAGPDLALEDTDLGQGQEGHAPGHDVQDHARDQDQGLALVSVRDLDQEDPEVEENVGPGPDPVRGQEKDEGDVQELAHHQEVTGLASQDPGVESVQDVHVVEDVPIPVPRVLLKRRKHDQGPHHHLN